MRDIIFRAWDKQEKDMIYNILPLSDKTFLVENAASEKYVDVYPDMDNIPPNMFAIMQYTGLKDKNGKEIYEGDIITHEVNNMIGVVTWGTYGFVIENLDRTEIIADLSEYDYNPVVIGNIYENPELLK